nr:MAG TPA: hypothetical protein [Bacteriophage sp.]
MTGFLISNICRMITLKSNSSKRISLSFCFRSLL